MKIPFLDLQRQHISIRKEIDTIVKQVISDNQFIGGQNVVGFEKAFARASGMLHCIGVGNATDALLITLKALEIGPGHEVIVPAHGWLSAAEMVSLVGATPVFADVDLETYGLDAKSVESKISQRTKAILPIHLYGQICAIEPLAQLARQHNLFLIEDAAQAHLANRNGHYAGSWGIASIYSFYPSKILGALGDGGAILTNNSAFAENCRMIANHGGLSKNEHAVLGLNSRLDALQAAVLQIKLQYAEQWITQRNLIAHKYFSGLAEIEQVVCPKVRKGNLHNFHIFCIRTSKRDALKKYLEKHGIQTEIHYPVATPFTPAFNSGLQSHDFPNSFQLQNKVLSLPIYPELSTAEVDFIVEKIVEFFQ